MPGDPDQLAALDALARRQLAALRDGARITVHPPRELRRLIRLAGLAEALVSRAGSSSTVSGVDRRSWRRPITQPRASDTGQGSDGDTGVETPRE